MSINSEQGNAHVNPTMQTAMAWFAPPATHQISIESTGCGLDDKKRVKCSCGHVGPWRFEADDYMSTKLSADTIAHRGAR